MKGFRFLLAGVCLSFSSLALATPVDINTASADELAKALSGVGLKKAQAIVDWRSAHGAFTSAEELTQVKGIGQALLDRNKADIQVSAVTVTPAAAVKTATQDTAKSTVKTEPAAAVVAKAKAK